ncbi:conserved hypothetical protein [Haliangium ochraceum DSM 14365]|uniref:Uncharacterized protein n=1 Tax=Haliangium ochraceum (strain DSM 14365 / JCM 11303 / SMP-2) TaxID=502025 RepID=D0LP92_HALO1|nr:conserved hypothetical protein [Haliangium ochraceum DSM 14365]
MRGQLIFAFVAEIYRLDTAGTAALDPDGAGPRTSGYDPDFQESVVVDLGEAAERVRVEHPPVRVPCQVETKTFEALRMHAAGNTPRSRVELVFHFRDLERLALVDEETGDARIRPSDRLGAIYDKGGALVQRVRTPPGLYVTEARPLGFGLHRARPRRNLLLAAFDAREQAAGRAA